MDPISGLALGFSPTIPQKLAGRRTEPPVSEPRAPRAISAAIHRVSYIVLRVPVDGYEASFVEVGQTSWLFYCRKTLC